MKRAVLHRRLLYLLCFSLVVFAACKKGDNALPFAEGKYTGKFYFSSSLGIIYAHTVNDADITFSNGTYTTTSNLPAGSSGTYQLKADTAVTFTYNGVPPPVSVFSTYLFDGQYTITHKGDSLILTRNNPAILASYQYRLKRN
jgi:hypothetical protein